VKVAVLADAISERRNIVNKRRKYNPLIIKEARAPRYNDCGYVVVKRSGAAKRQLNKAKPKIANFKFKNSVHICEWPIKEPVKPDWFEKTKDADQNFGTHTKKGNFIKKRRYSRWQNNPITPGRGMS
jgi:hypothetical protein